MRQIRGTACLVAISLCMAAPTLSQAKPRHDRHQKENNKTRNTLLGVGLGMLGGAILSKGDPWATVAGAAAGGAIGNVASKDNDRDRKGKDWDRRDRDGRYDRRR